jgi:uncharacterized protein YcaQ
MASPSITLDALRRYAVARSLFAPTTLAGAVARLGFVQADPIRAPARAQDLTLRHRVSGYRAGDLERRYAALEIEEDVFINYGFLPRSVRALMHPRARGAWPGVRDRKARAVLAFVRERGEVHPRQVDQFFSHGTVINYWGGSSSATTHLLDRLHYQGVLRVARRDNGIRIYAPQQPTPPPADAAARRAQIDSLVDVVVGKYAPVPAGSLAMLVARLRYAVPQWRRELRAALTRAVHRLPRARLGDATWYWPEGETPNDAVAADTVRVLAPFDPVVWDRRRFERFWEWPYRFEAYTPIAKRKLGYYALPLLWRDRVIGWGNVAVRNGRIDPQFGFVRSRPRDRAFRRELDAELARLESFLGLTSG